MTAYLIVNYDVVDHELMDDYRTSGARTILADDGRMIVRDRDSVALEGAPGHQTVVIEYPTKESALAAYHSEVYQAVIGKRLAATANHRAVVVEGLDA